MARDRAAYMKAWQAKNREKVNSYHRQYHEEHKNDPEYRAMKAKAASVHRRRKKYGITRDCYETLLTAQGGNCNICGEHYGDQLRVDHDHVTGEIRALLCSNCNSGLGLFQEDPVRMQQAIRYLELYQRREKGN